MKVRSFLLFFIVLISFFGCKEVVYIEDPDVNSTAVSKVTIKFDANGGQGEMPSQKVEKSVSTQINRNIFTKSGFKFTNWNTASDGSGQNFEDSSFVKFDSDLTLYAMWLPEDAVVYKVQHYQQNIKDDNYTLLETEYKEGLNSNKISESPREYQGFYVKDIQLSNEGTVVKVYYDRNTFTITLNTNEGNLENTEITVKYGDCLDNNLIPTKEGYYFAGWFQDEEFTTAFDFSTIINRDYTLFAKFGSENVATNTDVYTMIKNLTGEGPHYVKVTGAITSSTIYSIRNAMRNNSSALVILDLSETTGLKKLYREKVWRDSKWDYDYYSFYDIDNLIEVKLPESVTSIGDYTFYSCASLTSVELPESVTSIGEYAFSSCTSLTSVKLPEGTTEITSQFFSNCTSLKSIYIPSSVTTIAVDAFGTKPLEEIIVSPDNPNYMAIDNYLYTKDGTTLIKGPSNVTGEIVLPPEVTTISDYAFYNCDNLQSITMPSVTSIGNYAFYKCDNLQSITMPSVTSIGDYAFYDCDNLKTVSFLVADEITNIGNYAFYDCLRLESVEHSYGISVGECAFHNCGLLKLIPNLYGSIPYCAFTLCKSIEVLNFPAAIDSIDGRAFFGLDGLKEANFSYPFSCGSSNRGFAIYSKREGYWDNNTVISTYFRQSEGYTFDDFQGERGASIIKRYSASKNDYFDDAWDWYSWE